MAKDIIRAPIIWDTIKIETERIMHTVKNLYTVINNEI